MNCLDPRRQKMIPPGKVSKRIRSDVDFDRQAKEEFENGIYIVCGYIITIINNDKNRFVDYKHDVCFLLISSIVNQNDVCFVEVNSYEIISEISEQESRKALVMFAVKSTILSIAASVYHK